MTISIVIPVRNSESTLQRCLAAVCASRYADYECIVVDDGSTDGSASVAKSFPVRVLEIAAGPCGPAAARNRGAEAAQGDILLFVDADVVLQPDTLITVAATFAERPRVDAVFGSYDDRPADPAFLSQSKNLLHHFVHQQAREQAVTFWSGCGAIRKDVFFAAGGFDEARHPHSSSEDIDLGYRLNAAGRTVVVNRDIQVRHLKRWTLKGMVVSDLWERALPWTRLVLEYRSLPNDLNLHVSQRVCALLACALMAYVGVVPFFQPASLWPFVRLLLLTSLFVLTVGSWSGSRPLFQPSQRTTAVLGVLFGASVGLSLYAGDWPMMAVLALAVCSLSGDRWLPRGARPSETALFGGVVLSFVTAAGLLLRSLSHALALPLLGVVLVIVLINQRLFRFFLRKRGVLFTVAGVPLLPFYYVYSAAGFLAGFALHVATRLGAGGGEPGQRQAGTGVRPPQPHAAPLPQHGPRIEH